MLEGTLAAITPRDQAFFNSAKTRADNLIKPVGSMGKLEHYYAQLCAIQRTLKPRVDKRAILIFCGDHGVFAEGVAVCPQDVTIKQTKNFVRGYTGVCALAMQAKAKLYPVDIAINHSVKLAGVIDKKIALGTNNIRYGAAMTRQQAVKSLEVGIEIAQNAIADGHNILATGEMGICNTTPSAAILSVFSGLDAAEVTGVGANLDHTRYLNKIKVVRDAVKCNQPNTDDPIDVLAKVGGYEIGAMAGAYLGAAAKGVAVVVDGFISTVAALLAYRLNPHVRDYLIPSHQSAEKGAKIASQMLELDPPLALDMRLGEGSGGALMFNILEAACYMGIEMITFDEAGIDVV